MLFIYANMCSFIIFALNKKLVFIWQVELNGVEMWNDSTINNEAWTSNFCECWDNSIRKTIGHDHHSIWRLTEYFREDTAFVHTLLLQSAHGELPMKIQCKLARDLQMKLHNMCTCIAEDESSISDFFT